MPVPVTYRTGGEGAIASYNYTDISEGTGVVVLNGFSTEASGAGIEYKLTTTTPYSSYIETSGAPWVFNLSAFNLPKTIKGTAIVKLAAYLISGAPTEHTLTVSIQKVTTSGTTTLGSVETPQLSNPINYTLNIPLTETNFKKGDNLRLNIAKNGGAPIVLAHDPANREGSYIKPVTTFPTKLIAHIPFKLDL